MRASKISRVWAYNPGVEHVEIIAPAGAPAWVHDRARLWNAVEAGEKRKDAQLARDIELALPHELTPVQRLDLVRGFVASAFVSQGMVADIAIHAPCRRDADERNHHAHILLTMRAIGGDGFGPKVRAWNDVAKLEAWRAAWAEHVNGALAEAGENARVNHRSLAAQGIDREPTIHLGTAVVELAARGIETDRGEVAREIEAINTALAEIEAIEEPGHAPTPAIMPAPGHDLARHPESTRGGILALFRIAAREIWERVRRAIDRQEKSAITPPTSNARPPNCATNIRTPPIGPVKMTGLRNSGVLAAFAPQPPSPMPTRIIRMLIDSSPRSGPI